MTPSPRLSRSAVQQLEHHQAVVGILRGVVVALVGDQCVGVVRFTRGECHGVGDVSVVALLAVVLLLRPAGIAGKAVTA